MDLKTRHKTNPFIGKNEIKTRKKNVLIGRGNDILLNQGTGEVSTTNVMAIREVDDEQFIKLFTQNIGLMFEFTAAGNKAFSFLLWALQNSAINKDLVVLDKYSHEAFLEQNPHLTFSRRTLTMGINELEKAQIIAKAARLGDYYINPHFIFNGDRVRFITEIRRKSAATRQMELREKQGQQRLID